jgi:hypothetical protein
MFRSKKTRLTVTFVALLALMPAASGCTLLGFLSNQSFTINIPLGLNGFGGLLNPFGIITALVNTFIGSTFPGTGIGPLVTPTGGGGGGGAAGTFPRPPSGPTGPALPDT